MRQERRLAEREQVSQTKRVYRHKATKRKETYNFS